MQALKKKLREVKKTVDKTRDSLESTKSEHNDLVERVANCENEWSTCWDELTRRWNLITSAECEVKDSRRSRMYQS